MKFVFMHIVVLASAAQRAELAVKAGEGVSWIEHETEFLTHANADLLIDLTYENTPERRALLTGLLPAAIVVNAVTETLHEINAGFIRINGWATFLSAPVLEASCHNVALQAKAEEGFRLLNKRLAWLPDEPGLVSARVVSMIINEAFLVLEEGVSTRSEINTAMKLGTAYPYGPFEWAGKIGPKNLVSLLKKRSQAKSHYRPSALLVQEAENVS